MFRRLCAALALVTALPAAAQAFETVSDRDTFVGLIDGKSLGIALYGLSLNVDPAGGITGGAMGSEVTGAWSWQDGYFCREMAWGSRPIPYNCQLVEVNGDLMRFTTDRGAGESATFRLN